MLPNLMLYLLLLLDLSLLQAVHLFLVEYFIMQVFLRVCLHGLLEGREMRLLSRSQWTFAVDYYLHWHTRSGYSTHIPTFAGHFICRIAWSPYGKIVRSTVLMILMLLIIIVLHVFHTGFLRITTTKYLYNFLNIDKKLP